MFTVAVWVPLVGCATSAQHSSPATAPTPVERFPERALRGGSATLTVQGLSCPICVAGVDRQLRQIPGLSEVESDVGSGVVKITFESARPPTARAVSDAVRWGGATLLELRQP